MDDPNLLFIAIALFLTAGAWKKWSPDRTMLTRFRAAVFLVGLCVTSIALIHYALSVLHVHRIKGFGDDFSAKFSQSRRHLNCWLFGSFQSWECDQLLRISRSILPIRDELWSLKLCFGLESTVTSGLSCFRQVSLANGELALSFAPHPLRLRWCGWRLERRFNSMQAPGPGYRRSSGRSVTGFASEPGNLVFRPPAASPSKSASRLG
jgi:hypothetical protein